MIFDCLIMGDSIAVGTHQFKPKCALYAQSGITSAGWDKKYGKKSLDAEVVIISLGVNDHYKYNTRKKLEAIREKIKGKRVYWIEPNRQSYNLVAVFVHEIAQKYNDTVIKTNRWQNDKVHPSWSGYKELAEKAK